MRFLQTLRDGIKSSTRFSINDLKNKLAMFTQISVYLAYLNISPSLIKKENFGQIILLANLTK